MSLARRNHSEHVRELLAILHDEQSKVRPFGGGHACDALERA
jgi:hypothetical protein